MKLRLFYQRSSDQNVELETSAITDKGYKFEAYHIDDHREEYDHDDDALHPRHHGGRCFCDEPDPNDPVWPKLFNNSTHLASGWDKIQQIDLSTLK